MSLNYRLRNFILSRFSEGNIERCKILYRAINDVRKTSRRSSIGFPLPVDEIQSTLVELGISTGDVVHLHSSCSDLFRASLKDHPASHVSPVEYSQRIVEMLIQLVGKDGTILMNTDSHDQEVMRRIWAGVDNNNIVFDYAKSPSRRGLISELFRRREGIIRSVHPWYNVSAWGKMSTALIQDHYKSTPYTMDINSPWYKLTAVGGKVILLGPSFRVNSSIHLVENLHPHEFPRPVFFNKPVTMKYVGYDRTVKDIEVMLHAQIWRHDWLENFSSYLNRKYNVYKIRDFQNGARIICYNALDQYEALYEEMKNNVTWYDPQFEV